MKRKLPLVVIPLALLLAVVLVSQGDSPAEVARANPADGDAARAAGMMLYIDPDTGEFVEHSPGAYPVEMTYDDAYSTDAWGLAEEPSPKSGMMINLQGRFMSTFTATVDESGDLKTRCEERRKAEPAGSEKEGE